TLFPYTTLFRSVARDGLHDMPRCVDDGDLCALQNGAGLILHDAADGDAAVGRLPGEQRHENGAHHRRKHQRIMLLAPIVSGESSLYANVRRGTLLRNMRSPAFR